MTQKKSTTEAKSWPKYPNTKPKVYTQKGHVKEIYKISKQLLVRTGKTTQPGYYVEVLQDLNAHHLQKKAGDSYFEDMTGFEIKDVLQYYEVEKASELDDQEQEQEQEIQETEVSQ